MADKQPPQTTMPPVTLPPTMPPFVGPPISLAQGGESYTPTGLRIASGEADEKKFSIGFKQEGKGGMFTFLSITQMVRWNSSRQRYLRMVN
jgi:hypothetical protein